MKVQLSAWHEESNGREFRLADTAMDFCTPDFYGVHLVLYETKFLSVSVVEKIAHTMLDYTQTMFASPADNSAVYLI